MGLRENFNNKGALTFSRQQRVEIEAHAENTDKNFFLDFSNIVAVVSLSPLMRDQRTNHYHVHRISC